MPTKIAFIGTGGTIASVGLGPLDVQHYAAQDTMLTATGIVQAFPAVRDVADIIPVDFRNTLSPNIYFPEWQDLVLLCDELVAGHPDLAGIVIGHGTATLEETAYMLALTVKVDIPIVLVGSQRPLSALSTDAGLNLVNAVRTAASPGARGRGVLVVLNDEIQSPREVTKTSTFRMQTFRSPDFGILGQVDEADVRFYRQTERAHAPATEFDIRGLDALPRVDIAYSYTGSDGTAIAAFAEAGAAGIVCASLAPGMLTPGEAAAARAAVRAGIAVVHATRAGSGVALASASMREAGIIAADNLNPQKARVLLALALTVTRDPAQITRMFATY